MPNHQWKLIKTRNLTSGAVWFNQSNNTFIRSGDDIINSEAEYQQLLFNLGFPVPKILEHGKDGEEWYYVEQSLGDMSLHDAAAEDVRNFGKVQSNTIECATTLSTIFLNKQLDNSIKATPSHLRNWFEKASHLQHNANEHSLLNAPSTKKALATMFKRLNHLPMSYGHLDYGLPNMFPKGIIDWQYHTLSPIGFDVYLMLDLAAFMGGSRGYDFTEEQRHSYINKLDAIAVKRGMPNLSDYRADFLLVKSFFFIATVRNGGPDQVIRKAYRRELCRQVIDQYNASLTVDVSTFPTLAQFEATYVEIK